MTLCQECAGECCKAPWVTTDSDYLWPELTEACLAVRGAAGPCPELTREGACRIYDIRPVLCRVMEVDGPECRQVRAEAEEDRLLENMRRELACPCGEHA